MVRVAVVTGASSGIGAATALRLMRDGWAVVLVARTREKLEEVAAGGADMPGRAVIEALDAADGDAVVAMARRVEEDVGPVELVVNAAGAGQWKFIEETSPAEARTMMDAPYFAAFNCSHAFMAAMISRGRGQLIHVGSPVAIIPWPGATGYAAARWALRGLHEALCQDLSGTGVRSTHVVFGKVSSRYFENNPDTEHYTPTIGRLIRVISPEECAKVIVGAHARPRRQVLYPGMLWFIRAMAWFAPAIVRWTILRTGRRHQ